MRKSAVPKPAGASLHQRHLMKRALGYPIPPVKRQLSNKIFPRFATMPVTYKKRTIVPAIQLNAAETKIRNLLVEFCDVYNSAPEARDKALVLRVTGGWVRDKLLGDESNDLDIAINHISGEQFTTALVEYIVARQGTGTGTGTGNSTGTADIIGNSVHKIDKNPEKSKHLETCTTKLYGLDVDFVNLRNEEYTEESRIPTVTYGTPSEDAFRRDATLNALFYNLATQQVEDFTGKGLQDLENGILRTPLPARKTFLDDPLRCLRLIRFAARFGFEVDVEAMTAMQDTDISAALKRKISRERVGVEMHKILQGPGPEYGLELIHESRLFDAIFSLGDVTEQVETLNAGSKLSELHAVAEQGNANLPAIVSVLTSSCVGSSQDFQDFVADKQNKKLLILLLILAPWDGLKVVTTTKKLKNEHFVTDVIMREGLKYSAKESDAVTMIIRDSAGFMAALEQSIDDSTYKRSALGLAMRKYGDAEKWQLASWFNLLNQIAAAPQSGEVAEHVARFSKLTARVQNENLADVFAMKLIIDGKTLLKELSLKPGPWMKQINDQILVWQLDHPAGSRADCLDYVKQVLDR